MNLPSILFFLTVILLTPQISLAHGEDKPGPNGGFIRMPGAFHTEVIQASPQSLKIYLLDINWENPTVKSSSLKVTHKEAKITAVCKAESNYHVCQFPRSVDLTKKGELTVQAEREKQKGMAVTYELPLKLK